jgi:hypothetical protein
MTDKDLIEIMAQTLYRSQGGASNDEEFEMVTGKKLRRWRIEGVPFDFQPEIELCEWERDEFRWQAECVLNLLKELDFIG